MTEQLHTDRDVPDPHRPIRADGDHRFPVGTELRLKDRVGVSEKIGNIETGFRIPNPGASILACRYCEPAIRTEVGACNPIGVPPKFYFLF